MYQATIWGELTSYTAASPVRTLAALAVEKVYPGHSRDCGLNWPVSSASLDPERLCWRTYQRSRRVGERRLLPSLPHWGMTESGSLFRLITLEVPSTEFDGFMWVAPTTTDIRVRQAKVGGYIRRPSGQVAQANMYQSAMRLSQHVKLVEAAFCGNPVDQKGGALVKGEINPRWVECLMGLPQGWTSPAIDFLAEPGYPSSSMNRRAWQARLKRGNKRLRR